MIVIVLGIIVLVLMVRHGYHQGAMHTAKHVKGATQVSARIVKDSGVLGEIKAQYVPGRPAAHQSADEIDWVKLYHETA